MGNVTVVLDLGPVPSNEANALALELLNLLNQNPTDACRLLTGPAINIIEGNCDDAKMGYKNALSAWKDLKKQYRKRGVSNFKNMKTAKKNYKKCMKGKGKFTSGKFTKL